VYLSTQLIQRVPHYESPGFPPARDMTGVGDYDLRHSDGSCANRRATPYAAAITSLSRLLPRHSRAGGIRRCFQANFHVSPRPVPAKLHMRRVQPVVLSTTEYQRVPHMVAWIPACTGMTGLGALTHKSRPTNPAKPDFLPQ